MHNREVFFGGSSHKVRFGPSSRAPFDVGTPSSSVRPNGTMNMVGRPGTGSGERRTVPLSRVLGRRELGLTMLVEGDDPGIGWAVVSELTDPAAYLRGGELLLTAGVNLPPTGAGLRAYVGSLVEAGVSAVGFGVTPVHDTVPDGLVEQCRLQGLPLVRVPRPTPFTAVSQAVGEELEELHLRDLRRLGEAHQALTLAVTDDAPLERVLRVLAEALRGWALLARPSASMPEGDSRTPGAPAELDAELSGLVDRLTRPRGPRSAKARVGDDEIFLHTVGTPPEDHGVVLVGRPEPLGITDRAVLRTATVLLELLARTRRRDVSTASGRLLTGLLLEGGLTDPSASLLAGLVGSRKEESASGAYRVLYAHPLERGRRTDPARLSLGTPLTDAAPDRLRAVLGDRGEAFHRDQLDRLLAHGWTAALSGPVPAEELTEADRRVRALLARARVTEEPLMEEGTDPFDTLLGPAAQDFSRRVLGPLAERDDASRTLRRTLRAWLIRHGNWDRTAADLGVHRNSVRYRIGRIERDLGVDLSDAEQRMRLWFALTRLRVE